MISHGLVWRLGGLGWEGIAMMEWEVGAGIADHGLYIYTSESSSGIIKFLR